MKEFESKAAPSEIEKGTTCANNLIRASNRLRIVSKRKLEMQMQIDELKEELRQRYEEMKPLMTQIEEVQRDVDAAKEKSQQRRRLRRSRMTTTPILESGRDEPCRA